METEVASEIIHSPELLAFAKRQARLDVDQMPPAQDRRETFRVPFTVPAVALPVDESLTRVGEPIAAVTRDMTRVGVGLIVEYDLDVGNLLAVRFSFNKNDVCLLAEVLWSKPMAPFYYVGLRAVKSLQHIPGM